VATLFALVVLGTMPLLVYMAELVFQCELLSTWTFITAIALSVIALLGAGAERCLVLLDALRCGQEMLFRGWDHRPGRLCNGKLLKSLVG
jgi:hypothetical protein